MTDYTKMTVDELSDILYAEYCEAVDGTDTNSVFRHGYARQELARRAREADDLRAAIAKSEAKVAALSAELNAAHEATGTFGVDEPMTLLDSITSLRNERDRLAVQVVNAQDGDCLSGELGTIECAIDNPCGVCRLRMERDRLRELLSEVLEGFDKADDINEWLMIHSAVCASEDGHDDECSCGLHNMVNKIAEALR
jgi:hypothetical protein